ncbi:hypothetical protein ABZW32_22830 [Streptomyces sp. NPDC004667]|uniref:hypothetical protein n=1 Tax=Streptomyces sp. NPDC004667 TaxID=3154285 RepID=UPI0033AC060E
MAGGAGARVLERLRAVEWCGDWDFAFGHVKSRRVLLREYMRRAALWARAYSAAEVWPFFDVTPYAAPEFVPAPELAGALTEFLGGIGWVEVGNTCAGAVRLAELRSLEPAVGAGLPDLYEPLLLFYERGGEFYRDDAGFLELTGVRYKHGPLAGFLGGAPLTRLDGRVLDALDAEGRVTYHRDAEGRGPLLRRRVLRDVRTDELFGPDLRWHPAQGEPGPVVVDELEAARFIGEAVADAEGPVWNLGPGY